jgi:hypothetical protein
MPQDVEWLPIESAPKGDVKFLVRYRGKTTIGWFRGEDLYIEGSVDSYGHRSVRHGNSHGRIATHWMPLPEPPDGSTHTSNRLTNAAG